MRTIFKYDIDFDDAGNARIEMPKGAKLLHVACQPRFRSDALCVWAQVLTTERPVVRWLKVYGTGHEIDGWPPFVGTAVMPASGLVWHVFDLGEH